MKNNIDFVIAWVDGSDSEWLKEKNKYKLDTLADAKTSRFRDWNLMRYWFRGVEHFAPWVNNIYFLTWGHYPDWLNIKCDKIKIINHKDYIPAQYLPTFNSHTIELNIHRIDELSEKFVYFNDDMFLVAPTKPTDFFVDGIPKDSAVLSVHCNQRSITESHIPIEVVGVINDHFNMKEVINSNKTGWFNLAYGLPLLMRSMVLLPSPRFPGFWQHHLPTSFLKNTFVKVWEEESELLDKVCAQKFRTANDVSQWLMREWQLCEGNFIPRSYKFGKSFHIDRKGIGIIPEIQKYIEKQQGHIVVINDGEMSISEFEHAQRAIDSSFMSILSKKSKFEIN